MNSHAEQALWSKISSLFPILQAKERSSEIWKQDLQQMLIALGASQQVIDQAWDCDAIDCCARQLS